MATTFTFGDTFLNQLNTGQQLGTQQAVSKAELQMRAKQLQEEVLTAQLAREQTRLQMTLDQLANEREEEFGDVRNDYYNEQTAGMAQDREQGERDRTLGKEFSVISEGLVGREVNAQEEIAFTQMLEVAKRGETERKLAKAQLDALEDAQEDRELYRETLREIMELNTQATQSYNNQETSIKEAWDTMGESERANYDNYDMFLKEKAIQLEGAGVDFNVDKAFQDWQQRYQAKREQRGKTFFGKVLNAGETVLSGFGVGVPDNKDLLSNAKFTRGNLISPTQGRKDSLINKLTELQALNPTGLQPYQPGYLRGGIMGSPTPSYYQSPVEQNFGWTPIQLPQMQLPPEEEE